MCQAFQQIDVIIDFLTQIGLRVTRESINTPSFLPGMKLENGKLVVDTEKVLYPGDLLHEAGHLATMPADVRKGMSDTLARNDLHMGGEMMAIAWSYAACLYLKLDPRIVFHKDGYKGGSDNIIQNFTEGRYLGLPLLQWAGMACDENHSEEFNTLPYPHMICWVREQDQPRI